MAIRTIFGGYQHADNEAAVVVTARTNDNPAKLAFSNTVRWEVSGTIIGTSPADLAAKQAALVAAYSVNYQDASQIDTSTGLIIQQLSDAGSYTGVRVIQPPSFPRGDGAEFATERTYRIVLEAEYEIQARPEIVEYRETLTMMGGGPLIAHLTAIEGEPIKQQLAERTPYVAVQSGYLVSLTTDQQPPPPIFGYANLKEAPQITYTSADRLGKALRNYRVEWSYKFEAAQPLRGRPNQWPNF